MIDIIQNNPFRILGVYSDASAAEIKRNETKIRRFLEVGKTATFPTDNLGNLPLPNRSVEALDKALSLINLPKDRLYHALFWYSKDETSHDLACGIEELLRCDYLSALSFYSQFLHNTINDSSVSLLVESTGLQANEVVHLFLDGFYTIVQGKEYLNFCRDGLLPEDLDYAKSKVIGEPLSAINASISAAKNADRSTPAKNLQVGKKLIKDTKSSLKELKDILGMTDSQYQIAADSLAKQILQCGINYYNDTDDDDKIDKALEIQEYALSIAVGKLTKDRCQQNVDILHKHKQQKGADKDIEAIVKLLQGLDSRPDRMSSAVSFVDECIPHITALQLSLGKSNDLYIKICSAVANNALGFAIKLVNRDTDSKSLAESAMSLIEKIENLDVDLNTRNRITTNKSTLKMNIARMPSGFDKVNDATDGCLGGILVGIGELIFRIIGMAIIIGIIAGIAQMCS